MPTRHPENAIPLPSDGSDAQDLARDAWHELMGEEALDGLELQGMSFSFWEPEVLWLCFRRFFTLVANNASETGSEPHACIKTSTTSQAWKLELEYQGPNCSRVERTALFQPSHERGFFNLRAKIDELGGYLRDDTEDSDAALRLVISLPKEAHQTMAC